ncbi:MAG TPA: LptF/LptG family permease [Fimbriimonas sp.]|nr:LptF/LptG family permease [Fimbriimonas sp.]
MRLDRYVVREMIVPFLLGTFVVVMMFQANAYIFIAKEYNVQNIPLSARFQWIMFQTPGYMKMTLPVGMSLAAALALTRLTREAEVTALRAAGTRILRILFPVFIFGALVGVANFYIVDKLEPLATRKANKLFRENEYLGEMAAMKSNALIELSNERSQFAASLGTVNRNPDDSLTISDILLIERPGPLKATIITSKTGRYDRGVWTFNKALLYQFDGEDVIAYRPLGDFIIDQQANLDQIFNNNQFSASMEEQPTDELLREIAIDKKTGIDPRAAQVILHERYAVPASCAIFALTSSVFAVWFGRSGGFVGVLVSFFVVLLYYNAFVISTQILGKLDFVPPWLAAWLPNILFGLMGLFVLRRLE